MSILGAIEFDFYVKVRTAHISYKDVMMSSLVYNKLNIIIKQQFYIWTSYLKVFNQT